MSDDKTTEPVAAITDLRDFFQMVCFHAIMILSLPDSVLKKCICALKDEEGADRNKKIDILTSLYFSSKPKTTFKNGRPYTYTNIQKIINNYFDNAAQGITLPDSLKSKKAIETITEKIREFADDKKMLGYFLWKIFRSKDPKARDLLELLIVDNYVLSILTSANANLKSEIATTEFAKVKVTRLERKLQEKGDEIEAKKEEISRLKREANIKQIVEIPLNEEKYSRVKSENKELQKQVNVLREKLKTLENAQESKTKLDTLNLELNSRINRARSIIPEIIDHLQKSKGKIQTLKPAIIGLRKIFKAQEEIKPTDKPKIDLFIDSYDLHRTLPVETIIDFGLLKEWVGAFFSSYEINDLVMFVYISNRKGALIREAKIEGFDVEFLPSQTWISSLTCRVLGSKADAVCLIASNLQFQALRRALNQRKQKMFFAFPEGHYSEELSGVDFVPIKRKNFTRSR